MMETENSVKEAEDPAPGSSPEQDEKPQEDEADGAVEGKNEDGNDNDDDDASMSSTQSADSDSATPPSTDPELLLIKATALKDEGNHFFKEKDYEKASRSYRRGTSTLKPLNKGNTGDEQVRALLVSLQTNLSMMCFKLNKNKQCVQVASNVLKIDGKNVKALYRRAVANRKLGEQTRARDDLREALKLDPSNTAVKKELASLKKEIETQKKTEKMSMQKAFSKGSLLYVDKEEEKKQKQKEESLKKKQAEEAQTKRKAEWEDECVKRMAKGETALSFEEYEKLLKEEEEKTQKEVEKKQKEEEERRRKARDAARKAAKEEHSDSDDELTENELAQLRGYKKTSDGRTTSYFTRELSHEEKTLAAERNAPKKIGSANGPTASTPSADSGKGNASAWNHAGTWEEKDTTEWCLERLKLRLKETLVESESLIGVVTEVKDMTGDASVAIVSGKKRYIFDFHSTVVYDIRDRDTEEVIASGSFKLPDICSTHHEELEVLVEGWKKSPSENAMVAKECRDSFVSELRQSVNLWVNDFNNTY